MSGWLTGIVVFIAAIWLVADVIVFCRVNQRDFKPKDQSGADTPNSKP